MEEFSFTYRKPDNQKLFDSVRDLSSLEIFDQQTYSPICNNFFVLNETNWNKTTFDSHLQVYSLTGAKDRHVVHGIVKDKQGKEHQKDMFLKYGPLIDPIKYMTGKIRFGEDLSSNILYPELPLWNQTSPLCHTDSHDPNNIPYVDAFFSYLTGHMLHHHNFIHGLDFYGAWLAKQQGFHYDVYDEMETLEESDYFANNIGKLFSMDETVHDEIMQNSRKNKRRLEVSDDADIGVEVVDLADISSMDEIITITNNVDSMDIDLPELETIHSEESVLKAKSEETDDDCSSRSSHTSVSSSMEGSNNDCGSECSSHSSDFEDDEEPALVAIHNFPVQVTCLEKCTSTLDALVAGTHLTDENSEYEENSDDEELMALTEKEWASMVLQLLMTLICYQKAFAFTHNDLHSNNIMYVPTQKENIYYKVNGKHYKVPTCGRIFKIIDFGRAIYKFRGNIVCSNAFAPSGEAHGQYNCEPFFDENKPRLEPNFSFDLCRLATSLYDMIGPETEDPQFDLPIIKIILDWCKDDKGRNVLYKSDGSERYPDFKLYKMIARTVHNHTPLNVLSNPYFEKFVVSRKSINKQQKIINIDTLPSYIS